MGRSSKEGCGYLPHHHYDSRRMGRPLTHFGRSTSSLAGFRYFIILTTLICDAFPLSSGIITETIAQHSTENPRSLSPYKLHLISARCQAYCNEKNGVQNQTTANKVSDTYRPFLCKTDIVQCQQCSTICNTSYSKLDQCSDSCTSDQCLDTCGVLLNIFEEEAKSPGPVFANVRSRNLSVTAPAAACLYTPKDYQNEGSSVVIQWNVLNSSGQPSTDELTFVIEVYEENPSTGGVKDWEPLGHTNYSVMPIVNLNPTSLFKFRISVVSSRGLVAPPVTSELIHLPKAGLPQAPSNITVRQYMSEQILMAEVKWQIPNNVGCYFKLYCSTPSQKSYIYKELREWVDYRYELFNLTFDSNYTLEIQTYDRHFVPGNASAKVVHPFHTPNCLKSTNFSYSTCPPEAPLHFEFKVHEPYVVNETRVTNVTLSWRPPRHTSDTNPIEKYVVVWRKDPDIRYINQIRADRGARDLTSGSMLLKCPSMSEIISLGS
ncbi:hypothetical protein Btru_027949 [Bulinus truncatus]|nr:hypothetical protein Btru_027949 [Bulinus truncatus]